ncbi:MAG: hypothetical protein J7623_04495 [Chitinophaga sp.]|uniref:hypothetical protein n=1 Tax=Chitinophaga sp. TaxID=1869181 RepID=UPI001B104562|nr:hypothetical protein [Chitinophaga sp.]MBO9727876.1 hypothetical protein [Chitinophaga sp.]
MLKFISKNHASILDANSLGDFIDNLDARISSPVLNNLVDTLNKHYSKVKCSDHRDAAVTVMVDYLGLGEKQLTFKTVDCCCKKFEEELQERLGEIKVRE